MQDRLRRRGYVGLQLGREVSAGATQAGLVVRSVVPGSSAARSGLCAGDLLTHVEHNPAIDLVEVRQLLKALREGDPLLLRVVRAGTTLDVAAEVDAYPLEPHAGARTLLDDVLVDGHRLRAIAVLPETVGPHPVVQLLPGAHWASEEHPLEPEHPLPMLVGALARAGIGTLRIERSGMGDSEGPPCTRVDFAGELAGHAAGLDYLERSPWADPERLFLFGHSIGAMVAPLIGRGRRLRGVVTYGACAVPISEGLIGALRRHSAFDPKDPSGAGRMAERIAEIVRAVVTGGTTPKALFAARPDLAAIAPAHFHEDQAYHRIVSFYHQLEAADLHGAWGEIDTPSLVVHGGADWISSAEDSARLSAQIGPRARYLEVPGVDHHMNDLPEGRGQRLAPALGDAIVAWVRERMSANWFGGAGARD